MAGTVPDAWPPASSSSPPAGRTWAYNPVGRRPARSSPGRASFSPPVAEPPRTHGGDESPCPFPRQSAVPGSPSAAVLAPTLLPTPLLSSAPPSSPPPPRPPLLAPGSGSDATKDEVSATIKEDDLGTRVGKVFDAYRSSDSDLWAFLQNLINAGLVDEAEALALAECDLSPDLGMLWKLPGLAVFSFAGVPALLGYLGEAAGVERVPAWMPLVYSVASFLLGSLLVADASVGDEEREDLGNRGAGDLAFLESEEVLRRMTWRVPAAALVATAAGEAALRAGGVAVGVHDLQPTIWVAFLLVR